MGEENHHRLMGHLSPAMYQQEEVQHQHLVYYNPNRDNNHSRNNGVRVSSNLSQQQSSNPSSRNSGRSSSNSSGHRHQQQLLNVNVNTSSSSIDSNGMMGGQQPMYDSRSHHTPPLLLE